MKNKYGIINITAIQKRIEDLENIASAYTAVKELKQILSQSTPLIPEIEKAFDAGFKTKQRGILMKRVEYTQQRQDYISNLKLDI